MTFDISPSKPQGKNEENDHSNIPKQIAGGA